MMLCSFLRENRTVCFLPLIAPSYCGLGCQFLSKVEEFILMLLLLALFNGIMIPLACPNFSLLSWGPTSVRVKVETGISAKPLLDGLLSCSTVVPRLKRHSSSLMLSGPST